jgi:hypothetical protein
MSQPRNPCLECGACCAFYRASFYWTEGDDAPGGTVPVALTEKMDSFRRMMIGTGGSTPRCVALIGTIGEGVRCSIYDVRAGVCRDFQPSWTDGVHNERCDRARAAWGLPPLEPPAVDEPDKETPRPLRVA